LPIGAGVGVGGVGLSQLIDYSYEVYEYDKYLRNYNKAIQPFGALNSNTPFGYRNPNTPFSPSNNLPVTNLCDKNPACGGKS
jgi:hypothetical protein